MKKVLSITVAAALMLSVFTGCGGSKAELSKVEQIKKAGKLVVYTNAEFPPYEFMEGDEIVGVDVEIAKEVANKLGVKLEMTNADFSGIVASIASGKGDMALSGITINEERKQTVDFSNPYVDSVQYLVIPEDSDIKVVEDLAEKTLGGQTGTTGAMLIEDEMSGGVLKDKNVELKQYNSAPIAMQDVIAGRTDAIVIDELVAIEIAKENPGYKAMPLVYASSQPVTEQFGAAISKDNKDLLAIVNEVIDDMVSKGLIEQYINQYSE